MSCLSGIGLLLVLGSSFQTCHMCSLVFYGHLSYCNLGGSFFHLTCFLAALQKIFLHVSRSSFSSSCISIKFCLWCDIKIVLSSSKYMISSYLRTLDHMSLPNTPQAGLSLLGCMCAIIFRLRVTEEKCCTLLRARRLPSCRPSIRNSCFRV